MSVRERVAAAAAGVALIGPAQNMFEFVEIIVGEDAEFRAGEARGVNDARVDQFIEHDDVVLADKCADDAEGGGVAGRKGKRGLGMLKRGERFFQFVVTRKRTADQPGRARAGAEAPHSLDGGFVQARMVGESEVIVGGKVEQFAAADLRARRLRRVHAAQFAMQFLPPDFVESLLEFGSRNRSRW